MEYSQFHGYTECMGWNALHWLLEATQASCRSFWVSSQLGRPGLDNDNDYIYISITI